MGHFNLLSRITLRPALDIQARAHLQQSGIVPSDRALTLLSQGVLDAFLNRKFVLFSPQMLAALPTLEAARAVSTDAEAARALGLLIDTLRLTQECYASQSPSAE